MTTGGDLVAASPRRPTVAQVGGVRLRSRARALVGVLGFVVACEVVSRVLDSEFVPPASSVLARITELGRDSAFLDDVLITLHAWAVGLALAVLLAVPAGVLLGTFGFAYRLTRPIIELVRPVPGVAFLPLAILLFGHGIEMKAYLIAYAASWPVLYNTLYAVHDVDPIARDTGRSFGCGRWSVLLRITLPSAGPFIATGIRVSASIALVVGISAELLAGGEGGIGVWTLQAGSGVGNADLVFAGSVFAAVLGYVINLAFETLEHRLFVWHHAQQVRS
jgi:NitT/TauT family transport system permease protein